MTNEQQRRRVRADRIEAAVCAYLDAFMTRMMDDGPVSSAGLTDTLADLAEAVGRDDLAAAMREDGPR